MGQSVIRELPMEKIGSIGNKNIINPIRREGGGEANN